MSRPIKRFMLKDLSTGEAVTMNVEELLEEINRDRSEEWTDYDESDWEEGWEEWCEGDVYTLVGVEYER